MLESVVFGLFCLTGFKSLTTLIFLELLLDYEVMLGVFSLDGTSLITLLPVLITGLIGGSN